jgi:hypothetical protein
MANGPGQGGSQPGLVFFGKDSKRNKDTEKLPSMIGKQQVRVRMLRIDGVSISNFAGGSRSRPYTIAAFFSMNPETKYSTDSPPSRPSPGEGEGA